MGLDARSIIDANAYMTLATADANGVPWATPVWFAPDGLGELLWVSRPDARHSRNLEVRPEIGIVVFDSTVPEGEAEAVYFEATAHLVDDAHIEPRMATFSARSLARGGEEWTRGDVTGVAPHRLYLARATAVYLLGDHDQRVPVPLDR